MVGAVTIRSINNGGDETFTSSGILCRESGRFQA